MGHEDVKTTEIYTHVATGVNGCGVRSPLDGKETGNGVHRSNLNPLLQSSASKSASGIMLLTRCLPRESGHGLLI